MIEIPPGSGGARDFDVAVIGAGAAGLAAAIFAAEAAPAARNQLLDGARKLGAKILVSGGGRCNVTHAHVSAADFNGSRNHVRRVLAAFDERRTVAWFAALGVPLKTEETGKRFPVSDRARTVLDALLQRCGALGVGVRTEHRVESVRPRAGGGFEILIPAGALAAARVVLATGGRSLPRTGSDGHGYSIVRALGHSVTDTWPALVPLLLAEGFFHPELSGIAHPAELSTFASARLVDRRAGSLLWTHFGVSGPVAMDAFRHWIRAERDGAAPELRCSFRPGADFAEVDRELVDAAAASPRQGIGRVVAGRLPLRIATAIAAHVGIDPALPAGELRRDDRRRLTHALTGLLLPVTGDRGFRFAEVTAGGVPLPEVDPRTMESRIVPGLHLAGEILDCDGRIGGFNFQWAWSTGFLAGRAAAG